MGKTAPFLRAPSLYSFQTCKVVTLFVVVTFLFGSQRIQQSPQFSNSVQRQRDQVETHVSVAVGGRKQVIAVLSAWRIQVESDGNACLLLRNELVQRTERSGSPGFDLNREDLRPARHHVIHFCVGGPPLAQPVRDLRCLRAGRGVCQVLALQIDLVEKQSLMFGELPNKGGLADLSGATQHERLPARRRKPCR